MTEAVANMSVAPAVAAVGEMVAVLMQPATKKQHSNVKELMFEISPQQKTRTIVIPFEIYAAWLL